MATMALNLPELVRLMGLYPELLDDLRCWREIQEQFALKPDWTAVKQRAESHPEEARVVIWWSKSDERVPLHRLTAKHPIHFSSDDEDDRGLVEPVEEGRDEPVFALNVAVLAWGFRLPTDVLRALMTAHPEAVTKWTLNDACKNCCHIEVFEAILDQNPSLASAEHLKIPLRTAIERNNVKAARVLIRCCPEVLGSNSDDVKYYPIHHACERSGYVLPEMLHLLIDEGNEHNVGGEHGAGGLFVKTDHPMDDKGSSEGKREENVHSRMSAFDLAVRQYEASLTKNCKWTTRRNCWERLAVCLRAAAAAKERQTNLWDYPTLHAALSLGTVGMINRSVKDITEQEKVPPAEKLTEKDSLGRTPLDLALENMHRFEDSEDRAWILDSLLTREDSSCCRKVAASVAAEKGQTLFECAAECGLSASVLASILRAHPSLAMRQGSKTRLYPWMLLASTKNSDVADIFDLLRQNPSSVEGGITPCAHEEYLTKKRVEENAKWKRKWDILAAGRNEALKELKAEKRARESLVAENEELRAKIARLESLGCGS